MNKCLQDYPTSTNLVKINLFVLRTDGIENTLYARIWNANSERLHISNQDLDLNANNQTKIGKKSNYIYNDKINK